MSELALWAIGIGSIGSVFGLGLMLTPEKMRDGLLAFPRSKWLGILLLIIDLVWIVLLIKETPMNTFEKYKTLIMSLAPVAFFLIVFYLDELLAPRALGGLLLLVATPILSAARWHDSQWRLVVTTITYLWIVAGMILVLSPFRFRHWMNKFVQSDGHTRKIGLFKLAASVFIIILGLKVY